MSAVEVSIDFVINRWTSDHGDMLGAEQAGLNAGRHALAWVLGQTDIWYLLYRCANYVSKGHGHSPSSVSILDNLFTLDEDHFDYSEEEDFNNQFLQGRGAYRRDDPLNRFWSFSRLAVRSHSFTCPLVFKPQPFFYQTILIQRPTFQWELCLPHTWTEVIAYVRKMYNLLESYVDNRRIDKFILLDFFQLSSVTYLYII